MLTAKTFKTADGYCHILLDKIIFTESETPVEIGELKESRANLSRIIFYCIIAGVFIAASIIGFMREDIYKALFCLVIVAWYIAKIIRRNIYSTTPFIYRSAVKRIEFKSYIYSIQNPHFIVHYKYDGELNKKRIISLAGQDAQEAIDIMHDEFG